MAIQKLSLTMLESAANDPNGIVCEATPPSGFARALVENGMLQVIEPEGFFGGTFRITDKGRAFLKSNTPPIGEW